MVETSLFPRPHFASFLQSDDCVDPLGYYHYQRLQRLQKVARLQERRSKSHEPGYKKTAARAHVATSPQPLVHLPPSQRTSVGSRQIFAKPGCPGRDAATVGDPPGETAPATTSVLAATGRRAEDEKRVSVSLDAAGGRRDEGDAVEPKRSQTERVCGPPPAVRRFSRPAKSATVQGMQRSLPSKTSFLPRPKTAGVATRDVGTLTTSAVVGFQPPAGKREGGRKTDEDDTRLVDLDVVVGGDEPGLVSAEKLKENMAQSYHWTSATKRAYNEVDWAERSTPVPPPPSSTVEQFPDPVSQKLTFRRYHSCPEPWQVCGPDWDCVQSRAGDYKSIQPLNFRAPSSYNQHIPGYTGCMMGVEGEVDHPLLSRLLVRRLTPRHTTISKKANIPGYTGHAHWARVQPAHSDLTHPNPLTTARIHREIPLEEDPSIFRRTSPLSKTISLVSPYNPFNKIEY